MIASIRLELFVSGSAPGQQRFAAFVQDLVQGHPDVAIAVSDVESDPERAEDCGVVATPQTVRWYPTPVKRIIGELYDGEQLLFHLQLPSATSGEEGL